MTLLTLSAEDAAEVAGLLSAVAVRSTRRGARDAAFALSVDFASGGGVIVSVQPEAMPVDPSEPGAPGNDEPDERHGYVS